MAQGVYLRMCLGRRGYTCDNSRQRQQQSQLHVVSISVSRWQSEILLTRHDDPQQTEDQIEARQPAAYVIEQLSMMDNVTARRQCFYVDATLFVQMQRRSLTPKTFRRLLTVIAVTFCASWKGTPQACLGVLFVHRFCEFRIFINAETFKQDFRPTKRKWLLLIGERCIRKLLTAKDQNGYGTVKWLTI